MSPINLLPDKVRKNQTQVKMARVLSKIAVIMFILILIGAGTSISLFVAFKLRHTTINKDIEQLRTQIKSLQQTEQRLVLVKDRLTKIKEIQETNSAGNELDTLGEVNKLIPEQSLIGGVKIDVDNTEFALITNSSLYVGKMVENLINSNKFTALSLIGLNYTAINGYSLVLNVK